MRLPTQRSYRPGISEVGFLEAGPEDFVIHRANYEAVADFPRFILRASQDESAGDRIAVRDPSRCFRSGVRHGQRTLARSALPHGDLLPRRIPNPLSLACGDTI